MPRVVIEGLVRTWIAVVLLYGIGCSAPPPVQRDRTFEEIDLSTLIKNVERYHGSRVRVKGICRIEFESNALYLTQPAFEERRSQQALWMDLGWPPRVGGKELDGRRIVVDAVVDAIAKGHEGAFAGSLVQIDRLNPAP